ncbi:diguanylate cyclase domain-containing protein [Reinekea sp.]|jgi:diguanylate cyclase (GGDEF)-like protein/PAS domain S-box-containing protein|uniref:sensor domain-containing protein n=1 Tax=Reinekea sp. TaxID=1970455 RepID=UPI00398A45E2
MSSKYSSETLYQRIAENMTDMVALHAPDGNYLWISPSVKLILGYSPEELLGTSPYALFHPDDIESIHNDTHIPAVTGAGNILVRYRMRKADGTFTWLETLTQPMKNDKGDIYELLTTSRDVTPQRELEHALIENEALSRAIFDSLEEGVIVYDSEGQIETYNPQVLKIMGLSAEELINRTARDSQWQTRYPNGAAMSIRDLALSTNKPASQVLINVTNPKWKEHRWVSINSRPVSSSSDKAAVVVSFEDVTNLIERTEQLELWSTVFRYSEEAIAIIDTDGYIQDINEGFVRYLHADKDAWLGRQVDEITLSSRSEGLFARTIWPALESNGNWRGEIWLRDALGQVQVTWAAMTKVQQQVSAKTHYSLILSDISEKSRKEDKLRYNAGHDSLTGVPNRLLLNDRFDVALKTAERQGQTFACLFIDLDGFKPINDRYGHAVGDTVLQTVAEKIATLVRSMDTVSRIGGDEFTVLLFGMSNENEYRAAAERIALSINEPMIIEGHEIKIGVSIGGALYPSNGNTQAALMAASDQAMYQAKRHGRLVVFADSNV